MAAGGDKLWRREISLRQHRLPSSRPDDQGPGRAEVHALSANYDDLTELPKPDGLEYRSKPEMEYLLTPNFPTDGMFARTKFSHRTKHDEP